MKLKMKVTPMAIMAYIVILTALYILMLGQPKAKKSVRFAAPAAQARIMRPAPAHAQADPNSRMW